MPSTTGAGNRSTPVFVPAQEVQIMSMEEEEEFAPDVSTYSCEFGTTFVIVYFITVKTCLVFVLSFNLFVYLFTMFSRV